MLTLQFTQLEVETITIILHGLLEIGCFHLKGEQLATFEAAIASPETRSAYEKLVEVINA